MTKLTIFHSRFGKSVYYSDSCEWRIEPNRVVITNLDSSAEWYYPLYDVYFCCIEPVEESAE